MSAKCQFVFALGQQIQLIPFLQNSEEDLATPVQKESLVYSVLPPLPEGLHLDPKTGLISGIVADEKRHRRAVEHTVKVGVRVLAAWTEMVLGSVTLCEVKIKVRVVNLLDIQHQIRWIQTGKSNSLQIEFNDVQCFDDDDDANDEKADGYSYQ